MSSKVTERADGGNVLDIRDGHGDGKSQMANGRLTPECPRFLLGMAVPWGMDGTSHGRGWGPLGEMACDEPRLELIRPPTDMGTGMRMNWDYYAQCHAMLMQRPFAPAQVQCAKTIRAMGKGLWIDWDDDLGCVPESNPHFQQYQDSESIRRNMGNMVMLADVVTVSTEYLREKVIRYVKGAVFEHGGWNRSGPEEPWQPAMPEGQWLARW